MNSDCGANSPEGKGFVKGNTCAKGKGSPWNDDLQGDPIHFKSAKWSSDTKTVEWSVEDQKFITGFVRSRDDAEVFELAFGESSAYGINYDMTGKGKAFAVMSNVGKQTKAFLEKYEPTVLTFSADDGKESRADFYKFLTSRTHKLFPDYVGVRLNHDPFNMSGKAKFALVRRETFAAHKGLEEDGLQGSSSADFHGYRVEVISNAAKQPTEGVWQEIRGLRMFVENGVITKGPQGVRGLTVEEVDY